MSEIKSHDVNQELKDYWYQHFQSYQKSGLNKSAYVEEHKISKNRFMYWSRKFESLPNVNSHQDFVAIKIKSESNSPVNPVLCSIGLGSHQLLIHDLTAIPSIIQLLRSV